MRQVLKNGEDILKERSLVNVKTKQFGRLVIHDNQTNTHRETCQDQGRDKVGDKAHPKNAGEEQEGAHQQRQRGGSDDEFVL